MNILKRLLGNRRRAPQEGEVVVLPAIGPVTLASQLGSVWTLRSSRLGETRVLYRNAQALAAESRPLASRAEAQAVLDATQPVSALVDRAKVVERLTCLLEAQPPPPASAEVLQGAYGGLRAERQLDRVLLKRLENQVVGELAAALEREPVELANELRARLGWASRQDTTVEDVWVPAPPEANGEEVPLGFFEVGERLVLCDPASVDRLAEGGGLTPCLSLPARPGRWKATAKGSAQLRDSAGLFLIHADYAAEDAVDEPPPPRDLGKLGIDSGAVVLIDDECRFDDEFLARVLPRGSTKPASLGGHGLYVPGPGDGIWDVSAVFGEDDQAVAVVVRWD